MADNLLLVSPGCKPKMPVWLHLAGLTIISICLSGLMSAVMVAVNLGFTSQYLAAFSLNWAIGFIVSLPAVMLLLPPVIHWQARIMERHLDRRSGHVD